MTPEAFSAALAGALARELPGFVALRECARLSGGASQETYRLEVDTTAGPQRFALRRTPGGAPPADGVEQIGPRVEAKVIRAAEAAGVPVAGIVLELKPEDGLGEACVVRWLEGETLGSRIVKSAALADARRQLARQCGEMLARIHAVDPVATGLDRALKVVAPADLVRQTWVHYQSFQTPQPMIDYTAQWLLAHLPPPVPPALTHADFRNGNLMVGPGGLVGVLDWEISHLGDPMRDLGWLCTASWRFGVAERPVGGFGDYADLFAGYEAVSGRPVDPAHVRFWEVFGSFWWAVGCLAMAEHWRTGPDRTVERPAIGRRSSECQVDCVNLLIPGPVAPLGAPAPVADELPDTVELLHSVAEFLRGAVADTGSERHRFLARVAANSLAIVERETRSGGTARAQEAARLRTLLGQDGPLSAQRWALVEGLRAGGFRLDDAALTAHLRQTVVQQALIDQPGYPGVQTALAAHPDGAG